MHSGWGPSLSMQRWAKETLRGSSSPMAATGAEWHMQKHGRVNASWSTLSAWESGGGWKWQINCSLIFLPTMWLFQEPCFHSASLEHLMHNCFLPHKAGARLGWRLGLTLVRPPCICFPPSLLHSLLLSLHAQECLPPIHTVRWHCCLGNMGQGYHNWVNMLPWITLCIKIYIETHMTSQHITKQCGSLRKCFYGYIKRREAAPHNI